MSNSAKPKAHVIERLLRRTEAARVHHRLPLECLARQKHSLNSPVSVLDGPPFRLAGRFPLYPTSGLDTWAQEQDRTS